MIDSLNNLTFEHLWIGVLTLVAVFFRTLSTDHDKEHKVTRESISSIIASQTVFIRIHLHRKIDICLERGCIFPEEIADISDLYEAYQKLGGNSGMENGVERIMSLKICSRETYEERNDNGEPKAQI